MSSAEEFKKLINKRGQLKASLTRFSTFLNNFDNKRYVELRTRLDKVENIWSEFDDIQSQIEFLDDAEITKEERKNFEDNYFQLVSDGKQILVDYDTEQNKLITGACHDPSQTNSIVGKNVKLPTLDLPKFYGEYSKWLHFKDTFFALVHSDKTLNDVTKFHYLNSCLKGDAEQILKSLEATEQNYKIAWDLLHDRYENKKIIKRTHLKALLDWPPITQESHVYLRKLIDGLSQHLRALESLGEPTDSWDSLIIYIFSNKLDSNTYREWEKLTADVESPLIEDFTSFLTKRCNFLESLNNSASNKTQTKFINKNPLEKRSLSHVGTLNTQNCNFCKNAHYIFKCPTLLKLSSKARLDEIKKLKLCTNCLRSNHAIDSCTSGGCKHCGRKHNTMLHFEKRTSNPRQPNSNPQSLSNISSNASSEITLQDTTAEHSSKENDAIASVNTHCANKQKSEILLSTALVNILDKYGNAHECRVLLDSGSQSNFIRKDLCDILQLNKQPISIPVAGINQIITKISHRTNAVIQSKFNAFTIKLSFLVLDKITENLPISKVNAENINVPNNIVLADPTYQTPGKIDLLIGASVFFDLLSIGQVKLGDHKPVLQKTKLGWVISGCVPCVTSNKTETSNQVIVSNFSTDMTSIEEKLEKFWHIETINETSKYSREEQECEEQFQHTTKRDQNGHFIVELPIRDNVPKLGDSYQIALKRFQLLEKRLAKDEELKKQYTHFMNEYLDLGHMTKIITCDDQNKEVYYLPHHGVYKETSSTTKLRVVFDASAKSDNGISLNDKLKTGPTIQDDIFSILLRFRKHNFVIVADIEKMYRQILVEDNQRDLQRILWRPGTDQSIQDFRLNTVTYGTSAAAFLAIRSLRQVGLENQLTFPAASKVILSDFYVDDLLTGSDSIDSARKLKNDLIALLSSYGFPLRKWMSNDNAILEDTFTSNNQNITHFISDDKTTKTLGLLWNSETDLLYYTDNPNPKQERVTKRIILSIISQIFDPLGLVCPVVTKAKILLQKLWQLRLNWDEAVPMDIYTIWTQFYPQIQRLNLLEIPRHVLCSNPVSIQLHSFCDASEQAYGACIYIRSTDIFNNHHVRLLCAKSRVAPLKKISLPRLELCGALLAAQLTHKVIESIDIKADVFHWSDSTIALSWIAVEAYHWKTFVANRVSEIQRLTKKNQWKHVRSSENPADVISRGVYPQQLAQHPLWWNGPQWLSEHEKSWPKHCPTLSDVPERGKTVAILTTHTLNQDIFNRFSSFLKLQRVLALCLRFIKNLSSHRNNKITGSLSRSELNDSLTRLIKLVQQHEFASEIQSLSKSKTVSPKSKLASLNPFLDDNGLIRVGGRLKNANLSYDRKHPLVLPSHHSFTKLIISHEHVRHLHAGAQATLCAVRVKFWPLNGRNTVRGVLRRCIPCFKAKPFDTPYQMGQLPDTRLKPARPFAVTGIDFAGPFYIKDGKLRSRKIVKCYLCLFVCFTTKSVHLELAGDLSTDSFLNALKRFVSRRGLCSTIYSDNGTNFIGAQNELRQLYDLLTNLDNNPKFRNFVTQNSIVWNFIPPRAPHFGGIWEAAVKSAKYHLKRILGNAYLTYEEFYTVLTQVEAVLNSRPLLPLSNDPNDLLALTPSHFLIGEPLTAIPQEDVKEIPYNRLSHYKRLQQLVQHFWARWSHEYLTSLYQRTKWKSAQPNAIQEGTMVLLREDNTSPLQWKMGRVSETFPGQDGVIRVVNVKTSSGIVRRATTKICVLPIETEND